MTHQSTYSYRARIGLISPPTNTVNEGEWMRLMPEGVTFHGHKMPLHSALDTEAGQAALRTDLEGCFAMLAQTGADVIAYACTAGSMVTPARSLPDGLTQATGVQAVTTSAAICEALEAVGARRITLISPYSEAMNAHEAHFLADHGFEVLAKAGLGIGTGGPHEYPMIARTPLDTVERLARDTIAPGSDALLIACTDFPSLPLIEPLEQALGLPVISSNTATLFACFRRAGLTDAPAGAGRLFDHL